jgi:hypothetical protein
MEKARLTSYAPNVRCERGRPVTSDEIAALVRAEIGDDWGQTNAHGVDLRTCLVTPVKKMYAMQFSGAQAELWLVLEERPVDHTGYEIVFDERDQRFGLAIGDLNGPAVRYLGPYGTFLNALEAM